MQGRTLCLPFSWEDGRDQSPLTSKQALNSFYNLITYMRLINNYNPTRLYHSLALNRRVRQREVSDMTFFPLIHISREVQIMRIEG